MTEHIETIRTAFAADATAEARLAGAQACRALLGVLEPTTASTLPPVASIVAAIRGVPADQLLDLAIAKLRAALPAGAAVTAVQPLKFQLIPVPRGS
jgi:hypothetical protein